MKKIISILICLPTMAMAEFVTGNQLLSRMKSTSTVERAVALGYVMGVADANQDITYCPPDNVTAGQAHDMVKKALEEIPSIRNNTADIIVQGVLVSEWPCKNQPKGNAI
jgi:hypothetical protein